MISLDEAVVARLDSHGERFEILIDPNVAQAHKEGKEINVIEGLAAEEIFKNSSRGDRASEENLTKVFGTTDIRQIAELILNKGDIQLTQAERDKMKEKKRGKIVDIIVRNAINPQTNTPHPRQRIELAMKEAKINVDPFRSVDKQVREVLDALRPLLPIKFDTLILAVKLGPEDYGRCFSHVKDTGELTREEWQKDGSWIGIIEIPAGLKMELFDKLNSMTHGRVEIRVVE